MKTTFYIARTEIQKLFFSPVPWLILIIFTLQVAFAFDGIWSGFLRSLALGYKLNSITFSSFADPMRGGIFHTISSYLYLYIPLLTMGIMSRDLSSGSIKQLYSSPITNMQIIMGKYLSLVFFSFTLIVITGVFAAYGAATIDHIDIGIIYAGLLGLFLLLCTYCAIGLFMSSLTTYSVVAAMLTLGLLFILNSVGTVGLEYEFIRDITYWLSIQSKSVPFLYGLIASKNVLYFLLVTAMFIGFTHIKIASARKHTNTLANVFKYLGVFLGAAIIGIVSSIPKMQQFADLTRSKINTLSKESQRVLANLNEPVTIYTYSNMLANGRHANVALPKYINYDLDRFIHYLRFKPATKIKYEYYYKTTDNPHLDKQYPLLSEEERLEKLKEIYEWKFNIVPYEELKHKIDLEDEQYKFVRVLETESGKRAFLRVFDDPRFLPSESEITAAFKQLIMDLPRVGFVSGHGERDSKNTFDRGYNKIAEEKSFRYSFINQGFSFADISLQEPIADSIHLVILAEPKTAFSPVEIQHLEDYINRGGNMMICGEPNRTDILNPLTTKLGVEFEKGTLVKISEKHDPSLSVLRPTKESAAFTFHMEELLENDSYSLTFPTAGALKVSRDMGFHVSPLVTSDSTESWNEIHTTNFIDDPVAFDTGSEVKQPNEVVVALSRNINNKEQRIIVAGDADWISNGEIVMTRKDIRSANFFLIQSVFFWLSEGEAPIDTRRPKPLDITSSLTKSSWAFQSIILKWVLPGLLILFTTLFLVRRKGR